MFKARNPYLSITVLFAALLGFSASLASRQLENDTLAENTIEPQTPVANIKVVRKPSVKDIVRINADLDIMLAAMYAGEVDIFVAKTHPALFPLLGGEENFAKFTTEALLQIDKMGVKILSTKHETPGPYFRAGNELLSIVPRTTIMQIQGQKIKSTGFMVAIKNTSTNTWKYLDGAGLREDKNMLWQMFPELELGIEFPENKAEIMEQ